MSGSRLHQEGIVYLFKRLLSIFILTTFPAFGAISGESSPATIFVLGSGSSESPWTKAVLGGIADSLDKSGRANIRFIDHLDAGRFDEVGQHDAMFRYLKQKFDKKSPDVFITAGPAASGFSLSYPDLFPDARRILIQPKKGDLEGAGDAIIIETRIDYKSMVNEAIRLSEPESVYIVGDSVKPSDLHRLNNISGVLEQEGIPWHYLDNMALSDLRGAVSRLPGNSIVFFTPIYREYEGRGLPPVYVLRKLHEVASVPIFATSVAEIGFGTVGGYLHSPAELGAMAGEAAVLALNNQPVSFARTGFRLVYDWNEVVRWDYQNRLPEGAEIRFKRPSFWQEYKLEAVIFSLFLMVLVLLLVALTIYNRKLKTIKNALYKERKLLERKVAARTEELSILHQAAEKMARLDELTNINNRRAFFEMGEFIHNQSQRTNSPYTVVMIDIDQFKNINDTWGHAAGDRVIKSVADMLVSVARKSDVVARIGGEEFAVILTNTSCEQVRFVAERVRNRIEENCIEYGSHTLSVTVSVGGAEYQKEDTGVGAVLARADKALYQAKRAGRNKVTFMQ